MELIPAPLGVVIAAFVAGLFSFLGLVISKENKVSEFRQAWVDALRADIAKYVSSASLLAHAQALWKDDGSMTWDNYYKMMQPTVDSAMAAQTSIRLRVNPNDGDAELQKLNNALLTELSNIASHIREDEYKFAGEKASNLHFIAAPILKREWDRVKRGEPVYSISKWIALAFVLGSLALGGLLVGKGGFTTTNVQAHNKPQSSPKSPPQPSTSTMRPSQSAVPQGQ